MKSETFHLDLMREVAKLYYYEDLTQDQIGEIIGLSRQKVWRMLKKAKEEGIVQIKIIEPSLDKVSEHEARLQEKYSLKEVKIAVSFQEDEKILLRRVAQVAASYMKNRIEPYTTLGVAYGKTIFEMIHYLTPKKIPGLRVIQIMGGYGKLKGDVMAVELARRIAENFDGQVVYLMAPAFAKDQTTRDAIMSNEGVFKVLDMSRKADIALVGIGGVSESSTLLDTEDLYDYEIEELRKKKVVGNICGNFYDETGTIIETLADKRRISINLKDLQKIPLVIGVAGGKNKLLPILGALNGRFIKVLVTDDLTASRLINHQIK
ncbi:MAG: sugar-binding transcriptional regulator [Candidatus Atribacteria bacterium]|nr:sugar-binding transcriptional regulator [Candidatus Atribacteria bacterium]